MPKWLNCHAAVMSHDVASFDGDDCVPYRDVDRVAYGSSNKSQSINDSKKKSWRALQHFTATAESDYT